MKTPIIYNYNFYNQYTYNQTQLPKQKYVKLPETIKTVSNNNNINFTGAINHDFLIRFLRLNPLKHFTNFSAEEYSKLSTQEINRLRYECRNTLPTNEARTINILHDFAANCLKSVFDKRFGENNYIVITIGRSLSSIGKVLGYKIGENNVKNIPLSSIGRFYTGINSEKYNDFVDTITTRESLTTFLKYLESKNLSKENIQNSGKNYIIMDFCSTGKSLKGAEQLFKSDYIYGNNKNIYAVDFIQLIKNIDPISYKEITDQNKDINFLDTLLQDLFCSKYKKLATVHHTCRLKDVYDKTPEEIIKNADKETKLLLFKLLDYQMTKNKNKNFDIKFIDENFADTFKIPEQKIEPWHDMYSQYESDLRNTIIDIIKILTKFDNNKNTYDAKITSKINKLKKDVNTLFNYLTDKYHYQQNIAEMTEFYYLKPFLENNIQETLNTLSSLNF